MLAQGLDPSVLLILFIAVLSFSFLLLLIKRYRRCPSNKVLVVYGKVGGGGASKCIHGGAAFIVPLFQDYDYLDLEPIQIEIPLRGALSIENIRVNVPSIFTVAIGTEPAFMQRMDGLGVDVVGNTPEEFAAIIRSDIPRWAEAVRLSGAKVE